LACLYIAVFFNLSLFISTTTHNSATALLVCLLAWVIFILAIPNLAPVTAKILKPTPALQVIAAEKRAVSEEIRLRIARLTQTSGELFYGDKIKRETEKLEREEQLRHRQWDNLYKNACRDQLDLAQTLGRVSPSACWIYAASSLANTGPKTYQRLQQSAQRFSQAFADFVRDFFRTGREPGADDWPRIRAEELPSLKLSLPTATVAINDSLNDVLLLAILNVVFFMLAFVFFLRYDVR